MPVRLPRQTPEVSCVLLTDKLTPESARWFADVKGITNELVIFVDTNRADQQTHKLAADLATRLYAVAGKGCVEAHLLEMFAACRCEWILRLDSDEKISGSRHRGDWRDLLANAEYTYYSLPRRWVHPADGFIDCAPWWPDPQWRLFRNELDTIIFPTLLHEPMRGAGESGELTPLILDHHVLRLNTRAEREEKVRHYTRLRPEMPLGHYYLFEDSCVSVSPMREDFSANKLEGTIVSGLASV